MCLYHEGGRCRGKPQVESARASADQPGLDSCSEQRREERVSGTGDVDDRTAPDRRIAPATAPAIDRRVEDQAAVGAGEVLITNMPAAYRDTGVRLYYDIAYEIVSGVRVGVRAGYAARIQSVAGFTGGGSASVEF